MRAPGASRAAPAPSARPDHGVPFQVPASRTSRRPRRPVEERCARERAVVHHEVVLGRAAEPDLRATGARGERDHERLAGARRRVPRAATIVSRAAAGGRHGPASHTSQSSGCSRWKPARSPPSTSSRATRGESSSSSPPAARSSARERPEESTRRATSVEPLGYGRRRVVRSPDARSTAQPRTPAARRPAAPRGRAPRSEVSARPRRARSGGSGSRAASGTSPPGGGRPSSRPARA